jgi:predicted phage terminase large subunit-like protein
VKKLIVRLLPYQYRFLKSNAPVIAFIGGRGAGKTWIGAYRTVRRAAQTLGVYLACAPTYRMLHDVVEPCLRMLARQCGYLVGENKTMHEFYLANGSVIRCRSTDDPDRLRGHSCRAVWLDEAAEMPEYAYRMAQLTLRQGASGHWLAATFTPKGTGHWTYDVFVRKREPHTEIIKATTHENVFLPPGFLTRLESLPGALKAQEVNAEFVNTEGADWPPELFGEWMLVPPERWPSRDRFTLRAIAVDPSLGKQDKPGDYSAIVLVGLADGLLWVEADIERRPPWRIAADTIAHCQRFSPHLVGIEANQFQQLLVHEFERQAQGRFGVTWPVFRIVNKVPKIVRIRRLGPYITARELRVLANAGGQLLVAQLMAFPQGEHDDGPDALEMAVRMMLETAGIGQEERVTGSLTEGGIP